MKETIGDKIRYVYQGAQQVHQNLNSGGGGLHHPKISLAINPSIHSISSCLLFGLAIPLLLPQIIDKVLTQGNLSSLNVLGTAMVVMALFQGNQALRTFILLIQQIRMDLTLGSAVIDGLLALLSVISKKAIGELSQRLGELNTIRGSAGRL